MIGAGEALSKRVGMGGGGGLIQMETTQKGISSQFNQEVKQYVNSTYR
jgi:hypothetical protein